MKLLTASQIREWDRFTIESQQISSIELMERAAAVCANWIMQNYPDQDLQIIVFCGKGNNGGDGLAIARLILSFYSKVTVYIPETNKAGTADFEINLTRLKALAQQVHFVGEDFVFNESQSNAVIIDALLGTGITSAAEGTTAKLITQINNSGLQVISIDVPSGMLTDQSSKGYPVIKATDTLTLETLKIAFLMEENAVNFGVVHVLPIGLDPSFPDTTSSAFHLIDTDLISSIYKPRNAFTHKGHYGYALLITGSYGLMGASVLTTKACLRSGAGKVDCQVPACGYEIMQNSAPEAMTVVNGIQNLNSFIPAKKYDSIGVGPGIGRYSENGRLLLDLFRHSSRPIVIDADALYALSQQPELQEQIPAGSVLTPHGYEFERMFGKTNNDFERLHLAIEKAASLDCYIVLKAHHTMIVTPNGDVYFNTTGNAGMATGGSGDVLTGIVTGLMAQGYTARDASILGVYIHGLAGDMVAADISMESLVAGDIISYLGKAFLKLNSG